MRVPDRRISLEDLRDDCLADAACLYDPELHDGPAGEIESADARAVREEVAAQVCAGCPALDACAVYTVRAAPQSGVWAGLTPAQRAAGAAGRALGEVA